MKNKKFNLSGPIALVISLLILVVFVPINLIVSYNDKVYDMTPAKRYTLNDITVKLLDDTSDKDIEIYFLLDNLTMIKNTPELLSLYHTLSQLDARDNINLTCFSPDSDPELAKSLDPLGIYGVEQGDVFVRCGEITKRIGHKKLFPTNSNGETAYSGEELIAGAIKTCTSGSLPTIYFLQGHGEKTIASAYSRYSLAVKANNYDTKELDLAAEKKIPDNTAIIYLVAPTSDISNEERDILIDFLGKGGSISMLIPPCENKVRFENIEAVLRKYGLEMDYNIVSDTNPVNQLNDRDSTQNPYFFRVSYPVKTDDFTEDLTTDLNTLISYGDYIAGISNTRSFGELPEGQFANTGNFEISSVVCNVTGADGTYSTVSKSMGGDEESAKFADEKLSGVKLDFGFYSYDKATGGKLFVLGTDDMIGDNTASISASGTQVLTLFSNTWLKDIDVDMGIGSKATSYDKLEFEDAKAAKKVMGSTVVLPAVIIILGVAVWLKRRHA